MSGQACSPELAKRVKAHIDDRAALPRQPGLLLRSPGGVLLVRRVAPLAHTVRVLVVDPR
jgi:hypothetical protein